MGVIDGDYADCSSKSREEYIKESIEKHRRLDNIKRIRNERLNKLNQKQC
jgi:hypothetical protein